MKKLKFLGIIVGLLLVSCSPPMYIPDAVHVSTLNHQGEVEIMATGGTNGFDLGGAYAITDNFGIQAKGSIVFSGGSETQEVDFARRYYADLGIGYSEMFGTDESLKGVFSIFGGAGYGEALGRQSYTHVDLFGDNSYTTQNTSHGNFMKYWIQPMIGMKMTHFELLFTPRINFVNFTYLYNNFEYNPAHLDWQNGYTSNIYYEPVITLRVGGARIKAMVQMGASIQHLPREVVAFKHREGIFNFGLSYNIGPIEL
jgi:hypothetical protein